MSVFKLGQFSKDTTTTCNNGDYLLGGVCTICPEQYYCDGVIKTKCASNEYCAQGTGTAAGGSAVDGPLECTGDTPFVSYTAVTATGDGLGKGCKACNGSWTPSQVGAGGTCVPCAAGTKWDELAAQSSPAECTRCPDGTYQDATGQKVCKQCPFNSSNTTGATVGGIDVETCTCDANYYEKDAGAKVDGAMWTCNPCGANSSRSGTSSVNCTCDAGYNRDGNAGSDQKPVCTKCPVDSWSAAVINSCTLCESPTPHTVNTGSTNVGQCMCKIGYDKTNSTCELCGTDEIGISPGVCQKCPDGQTKLNNTTCENCPDGKWSTDGVNCTRCGVNTKQTATGCTPCPFAKYRAASDLTNTCSSPKASRCLDTQFYNKTSGECVDKPEYIIHPDHMDCAGSDDYSASYQRIASFEDCGAAISYINNVVPHEGEATGWKHSLVLERATRKSTITNDKSQYTAGDGKPTGTGWDVTTFVATIGAPNNNNSFSNPWKGSPTGCTVYVSHGATPGQYSGYNETGCDLPPTGVYIDGSANNTALRTDLGPSPNTWDPPFTCSSNFAGRYMQVCKKRN